MQIINSLANKETDCTEFVCMYCFCCLFVCLLGSHHCTFVLAFPFSNFLCDCSSSHLLYFVRLKCNIHEVSIQSPKEILAFSIYKQSKKTAENGGKRKEKKLFVFEVVNALRVILEENNSSSKYWQLCHLQYRIPDSEIHSDISLIFTFKM